jgi:hypothetical protein
LRDTDAAGIIRRMNRRLLWVAMMGVACGGSADFSGHWAGNLQDVGTCSDGSSLNRSEADDWIATQSGNTVSFAGNSSCGIITAAVSGDTATLQAITCTPVTDGNGVTTQETITGGSVVFNGGSVAVNATISIGFSGAITGSCSGTASGSLSKQ